MEDNPRITICEPPLPWTAEPEGSLPFHIRSAYDEGQETLTLFGIGKDGAFELITIREFRPLLGHPKTDECCGP